MFWRLNRAKMEDEIAAKENFVTQIGIATGHTHSVKCLFLNFSPILNIVCNYYN